MEATVSIRRCEDYDPAGLDAALTNIMTDLGGIDRFVKRGDRVLLKPNLLMSARPEKAIVTHPAFVGAVAALVKDAGGTPFLGDSPPLGNLVRVASKSGYDPMLEKFGIKLVPFKEKLSVEFSDGRLFRRMDLAREVFEFDAVISLAKLKTHCQMFLTLAVKNLFGTVIGTDKAAWHLRAGRDCDSFATALVQIYEKVKPAISVIDGILGMEGTGPNNGTPRHVGIIAASTDGVALDATVCRMLGFRAEDLRTCALARSMGIGVTEKDKIRVLGDSLNGFPLTDFEPPKSMTVTWNLSKSNLLRRFLEDQMVTRPHIDPSVCSRCKVCLEHCPPGAISETKGKMVIDYRQCISCFCCHELCTSDAIHIVKPFLGRVLSRFK